MENNLSVDAVPHRSEALTASSSSTSLEMKDISKHDIVDQVAKATEKTLERNIASGGNTDEMDIKIAEYLERNYIPYELSFSYKDAFILCTEDDEKEVKAFRDILVDKISLPGNEKPKVVLFSEISNSIGNMFQALEFALSRCTFVCLYITSKFIEDKWSEYSSETCLMEAITNPERKWSVVPIRKSTENVQMPMIIRTLKGVRYDPSDNMYMNMMGNLFKDRLSVRKSKEREHRSGLIKWVQDFEREELARKIEMKKRLLQEKQVMEKLHKQNLGLDHSLSCSETENQNKVPGAVGLQHSAICPSSYNPVKYKIMQEYIRNLGNVEEKMDERKENSYIKATEVPSDFSSPVDDLSYTSMPEDSGNSKDGIPTGAMIQSNVVKQVIHKHYHKTTNVNANTVQIGRSNVLKNINQPMNEKDTSQSVNYDEDDCEDEYEEEEEEEEYILDPLGVGEAKNTKIKDGST